jgi:hypothetical protein
MSVVQFVGNSELISKSWVNGLTGQIRTGTVSELEAMRERVGPDGK